MPGKMFLIFSGGKKNSTFLYLKDASRVILKILLHWGTSYICAFKAMLLIVQLLRFLIKMSEYCGRECSRLQKLIKAAKVFFFVKLMFL